MLGGHCTSSQATDSAGSHDPHFLAPADWHMALAFLHNPHPSPSFAKMRCRGKEHEYPRLTWGATSASGLHASQVSKAAFSLENL